jgi:hypothetical protein
MDKVEESADRMPPSDHQYGQDDPHFGKSREPENLCEYAAKMFYDSMETLDLDNETAVKVRSLLTTSCSACDDTLSIFLAKPPPCAAACPRIRQPL